MSDYHMKNTSLCYIEQDGKYLMLHRVKKEVDINKDKWVGIGGKFEAGESPEECMLREVREETGLQINGWRYRAVITFVSDEWGTEYMHLFTAHDFSGEILSSCSEGNLEWVAKSEVRNLPIWEGDKIFFDLLDQDIPFFSLKLCYTGDVLTSAKLNGKDIL